MVDHSGKKFGKLIALEQSERKCKKNEVFWKCVCDCGAIKEVRAQHLALGRVKSCGCMRIKHGETGSKKRGLKMTPEYKAWMAIKDRCLNEKDKRWPNYGGRGISVCERWKNSYLDFLADVGRRPAPTLSVDRINNNGNYEPGNIRWATKKEQANNTRRTKN